MKKTDFHHFIPQMLVFLCVLGLFVGLLSFLKNPDMKPFEYDHNQVQLVSRVKPIPTENIASNPDSTALPIPLHAGKHSDEIYQKAMIAARDNADVEAVRLLLQKALRENPGHIGAADALYASYEKRQDWEGALAVFQKLESENTDGLSTGLDYALGRLYLELGHPDQSRLHLEEAMESDADNPLIREQLASAYNNLGERDWARREWQRLAQDESAGRASWNAKIRLAEDLFAEGRWAEAEAYAKDILKQDPQNRLGTLLSEH